MGSDCFVIFVIIPLIGSAVLWQLVGEESPPQMRIDPVDEGDEEDEEEDIEDVKNEEGAL